MIACDAMAPAPMAVLSERSTRSAGDARQGVPDEALIDALGFDERVTKRSQRALAREGLVDLTTVPPMTHVGRPVMAHAPRHRRQQTIGLTPHGQRLMEDLCATRADTAPPHPLDVSTRVRGQALLDQQWGAGAGAPRHVCSRPSAHPPRDAPPAGHEEPPHAPSCGASMSPSAPKDELH
jgi:hypothetical protein